MGWKISLLRGSMTLWPCRVQRGGGGGRLGVGGRGGYLASAWRSHLTIDHASLLETEHRSYSQQIYLQYLAGVRTLRVRSSNTHASSSCPGTKLVDFFSQGLQQHNPFSKAAIRKPGLLCPGSISALRHFHCLTINTITILYMV